MRDGRSFQWPELIGSADIGKEWFLREIDQVIADRLEEASQFNGSEDDSPRRNRVNSSLRLAASQS